MARVSGPTLFSQIALFAILSIVALTYSCGDADTDEEFVHDESENVSVTLEGASDVLSEYVIDSLLVSAAVSTPVVASRSPASETSSAPTRVPFVILRATTTDLQELVGRIWEKGSMTETYRPYGPPLMQEDDKTTVQILDEEPYVHEVNEWENNGDASLLEFLDVSVEAGQKISTTLTHTLHVAVKTPTNLSDDAVTARGKLSANDSRLKRLYVMEAVDCWLLTYEVNQSFTGRAELNVPLIFTARDKGFKKVGRTRKVLLYTATMVPLDSY